MTIRIEPNKLDHQGRGIARHDGKIVFVPNALPGEILEINLLTQKKNYSIGKVVNYIKQSPQRTSVICPYYDKCGGCHLSHLGYKDQINYKQDTLINIFKKYVALDINPEIITDQDYAYRNKITLKIVSGKWGYYAEESHSFVAIEKCLLAKDAINQIINNRALFKIKDGEITIRGNYNDEIIISINTKDKVEIDIDRLTKEHKMVGIIINHKIHYGEDKFIEIVDKFIYQVNYDSFFQINLEILSKVINILNQKQVSTVLDLYCGVGTLGIAINKEKGFGIETNGVAIKNALINNEINKQKNLYMLGDSANIREIKDKLDLIIIDPPRSGVSNETINHIMIKEPKEIIYMSCNPMTLARDLNILKEKYKLEKIYLLDMFPQTHHIESLCILKIKL